MSLTPLLAQVNAATQLLATSDDVPAEVGELIDSLDSQLGAPRPIDADPYLTTTLWSAAFRAEKALRHDNAGDARRDVRLALEQVRQALRDIVDRRPYGDDIPIGDVLGATLTILDAPQGAVAELFGVSVRQLQRWLAPGGAQPSGLDAARVRIVAQIANQLRHTFTGPGVLAWFARVHPTLGRAPIEMLGDPPEYPKVLAAATAARAMTS
ncbi:hypothetical protein B5P44_00715 [Mycobacterium sp. CBMA 213]|nr:hypothetical protein [Mycolicibacterium sp. CBMA 213]